MPSLNETPSSNRIHIGIFGKTNSGKSSLINAFTNQSVSIVSDLAGTTTDPVYKSMEIHPIGPCMLIDTAGFCDYTDLSDKRYEKTKQVIDKSNAAVIVISACDNDTSLDTEIALYKQFKEQNTPVIFVINKADIKANNADEIYERILSLTGIRALAASALEGDGISELKDALSEVVYNDDGHRFITGSLVSEDDCVLLVMPQDIQAPKGRLILPQVQTLRELLDKKCHIMCVTTDKLVSALELLKYPPKLIITDSQVFDYVYEHKPQESLLTSFSVLFAAYKGDIEYYIQGAKMLDELNGNSKVLIAECCTHAPLSEDIGRVKLPKLIRKRAGDGIDIQIVSGADFPDDLKKYDLIIQCGACMFNRKFVLSRLMRAKHDSVPMTNYGIAIAYLKGILDKIEVVKEI